MADDTDPESKTEEPSAKKLSDARAKGDVVKSADIPQLASLLWEKACPSGGLLGRCLSGGGGRGTGKGR